MSFFSLFRPSMMTAFLMGNQWMSCLEIGLRLGVGLGLGGLGLGSGLGSGLGPVYVLLLLLLPAVGLQSREVGRVLGLEV